MNEDHSAGSFFKRSIIQNWHWILLVLTINAMILYIAVRIVKAAWD